ncbi:hypothetical protein PVAND_009940 [Polypedilum vanderplanki]|uniref:Uncharacterized protein n=1 Tax=Polypedilum vanderplanki TaxID=319348 RepID=A0A9J6CF48_POLVA|nr:hypothetical protein PVAND_009940 [Polypedilum vanderplanki]
MHQQLPTEVANKRLYYLPRASISSVSHSGSSSKSSNRSREYTPNSIDERLRRNVEEEISELNDDDGESEEGVYHKNPYHYFNHEHDVKMASTAPMYIAHQTGMPSFSSSSSSSNQSNYSVNSLLLSVKNLENFNRANDIDRKHHHHHHHHHHLKQEIMPSEYNPNIILKSNYYLNYFANQDTNHFPLYEQRWKMLQNIRNIATHDEKNLPSIGLSQGKETEADQLSTASSTTTTNFTVISLNDSSQRLNKSKNKSCCRRSHTISILIFVMTSIFVIFISIMLFLMDMRNQKMPR